jgi:hypothetical protein
VITALRKCTSRHRILLAIVLSLVMHAAALWLLPQHIQHDQVALPSLSVKLVSRPTLSPLAENLQSEAFTKARRIVEAAKLNTHAAGSLHKSPDQLFKPSQVKNLQTEIPEIPRPVEAAQVDSSILNTERSISTPLIKETKLENAPTELETDNTITDEANKLETIAVSDLPEMEKSDSNHAFPKHLQLIFNVSNGSDNLTIGEIHQQLDIIGDKYSLKSTRETAESIDLFVHEQVLQSSEGKVSENGLQPDTFVEDKVTAETQQKLEVFFDWKALQMHFSHGEDAKLPADTQDALSYMYQFSQISMQGELISVSITNGARLESLKFEIGTVEDILTPMGKLRALHLKKVHEKGEAYFELWLGFDYRLLPIKFRRTNELGNVTEEFAISDIRGKDE